jgi:hypothetical protein
MQSRKKVDVFLGETVTIDGRGNTVQEAVKEMWDRMQPLERKGFHPISEVEIVDTSNKEIIETYQLTDPEFTVHLKSDEQEVNANQKAKSHVPESKEHYLYIARIRLEN